MRNAVGRVIGAACCVTLFTSCAREGARSEDGTIVITRVVAPAPVRLNDPSLITMAVYATIANRGDVVDTLVAVSVPHARASMHHTVGPSDGAKVMMPASMLLVPAKSFVRFAPGGSHVMLDELTRRIAPGDTLNVTFSFRRAGKVQATARVVAYEDIEKALAP